ncbi:Protein CLEC-219 [Anopheles sinensis]|uniref:Protein CLEC-219 n=1 Tax=Anopheles sinensis TaxID=74873 RepID=A0A084WJC6_ANOSI|nr:Protein CLEC-219 [Anopheles sinensis]
MCNRMCAYVHRLALLGFCIVAFSVFWWCFFCSIYVVMFGDELATATGAERASAQDCGRVAIMASSDDGHFGSSWA